MSQSHRYSRRCLWSAGSFVALILILMVGVPTAPVVGAGKATITIDNFTFTPAQITVPVGTEVTWINNDDIPHLVVVATNPRAIKSQPLDTGDRYSFTYATAGTYPYFCGMHPHMTGTVIVR